MKEHDHAPHRELAGDAALDLGFPPPCVARLCLSAEPSLAELGAYDRFGVISLARHMIDALARIDRDIAFDVAAALEARRKRWRRMKHVLTVVAKTAGSDDQHGNR